MLEHLGPGPLQHSCMDSSLPTPGHTVPLLGDTGFSSIGFAVVSACNPGTCWDPNLPARNNLPATVVVVPLRGSVSCKVGPEVAAIFPGDVLVTPQARVGAIRCHTPGSVFILLETIGLPGARGCSSQVATSGQPRRRPHAGVTRHRLLWSNQAAGIGSLMRDTLAPGCTPAAVHSRSYTLLINLEGTLQVTCSGRWPGDERVSATCTLAPGGRLLISPGVSYSLRCGAETPASVLRFSLAV